MANLFVDGGASRQFASISQSRPVIEVRSLFSNLLTTREFSGPCLQHSRPRRLDVSTWTIVSSRQSNYQARKGSIIYVALLWFVGYLPAYKASLNSSCNRRTVQFRRSGTAPPSGIIVMIYESLRQIASPLTNCISRSVHFSARSENNAGSR